MPDHPVPRRALRDGAASPRLTVPAGRVVLLFVYNVDGSPIGLLKDLHRGITTGSTDCNLCDVTFGTLLKDRSWKRFVDDLPVDVDFQLRSTFRRRHPELAAAGFPSAWWVWGDDTPEPAIPVARMASVGDLDELRALVTEVVSRRPTA